MFRVVLFLLAFGTGIPAIAQDREARFRQLIDSTFNAHLEMLGVLVHVESPGQQISYGYAAGKNGISLPEPLNVDQPLLVASNTKTFIAAAILRLVEQGKLSIEDPIGPLLTESSQTVLEAAGYRVDSITVRYLLSHTSGIRDYVDDSYFEFIDHNKQHEWTRQEQVARAAASGAPAGKPGSIFRYADVNFVLLSEIIETVAKKPFYTAVRELLGYKKHRLNTTWFIKLEKQPANSLSLVNQYWGEFKWEIRDFDPSWDLYGGGGIASNVKDLAHFYQLLFNRKIIRNQNILTLMTTDVPPNLEINYCLGIRKIRVGDLIGYNHGGGLGTDVTYFPALNATISIASVNADNRNVALEIRNLLIAELAKK